MNSWIRSLTVVILSYVLCSNDHNNVVEGYKGSSNEAHDSDFHSTVSKNSKSNSREENGVPISVIMTSEQQKKKKIFGVDPKEKADNFVQEYMGQFLIEDEDPLTDLKYLTHRRTLSWSTTRFQQTYMGIPVYNGDLAVTIDEEKHTVVMITGNYQPGISLERRLLKKPRFLKRALEFLVRWMYTGGTKNNLYFKSNLVIYKEKYHEARLVWKVDAMPTYDRLIEVFFDAETGNFLFELQQLLSHKRGSYLPTVDISSQIFQDERIRSYEKTENRETQVITTYVSTNACIFDPDPISTSKLQYGKDGMVDNEDASSENLNSQLQNRTIIISETNGVYSLEGPWAKIIDADEPFDGTFEQTSPDFCFERNHTAFEAVNAYYHVSAYMKYINQELGIEAKPYQYDDGVVRIDPHAANGHDNSYYNSQTSTLFFGTGGVDDAEDSEVVIHELAHGIHDWICPGGISQVTGLSEGFSDYIAASHTRSKNLWNNTDPEYYWVMRWDGHNEFWEGRTTDYEAKYPAGLTGIYTTDGQIYSTCSMRVWDKVGREMSDKLQLMGISATSSSSTQEDAANAVVQAAYSMGLSEEQVLNIRQIYEDCGYEIADGSCGDGVIGPGEDCEYNGYFRDSSISCLDVNCKGDGVPVCSKCKVDYSTCETGQGQFHFQLDLLTDNYGYDTSWELIDRYGNRTAWGSDYDDNKYYTEVVCLEKSKGCYDFSLYDSFGDGLCCENGRGEYSIYVDGNLGCLETNPEFEAEIQHRICPVSKVQTNLFLYFIGVFIDALIFWV